MITSDIDEALKRKMRCYLHQLNSLAKYIASLQEDPLQHIREHKELSRAKYLWSIQTEIDELVNAHDAVIAAKDTWWQQHAEVRGRHGANMQLEVMCDDLKEGKR